MSFNVEVHQAPVTVEVANKCGQTNLRLDGLRVLVAEDNEVNQLVCSELLQKVGASVRLCSNGREAIDAVQANGFDAILMDLQMPEIDGIQAALSIRKFERAQGRKRMPIVALTAHAAAGDEDRFISSGMDGYVSKPIDFAHLIVTLKRVVYQEEDATEGISAHLEDNEYARESTLIRLGGSIELLHACAKNFLDSYPSHLRDIEAAVSSKDASRLRDASHLLRGVISLFGADGCVQILSDLEHQAGKGFVEGGVQLERLKNRIDALVSSLQGELNQPTV